MRATWEHFASTTTVGGLAQLHNAQHLVLKAIWLIIFLVFTGLTCYNSYTVFLDYFNYPVLTYVSVSYERSVPFPAVTVCNLNPMPCSKITLAYMKNPESLSKLYHLSKCNSTVGRPPLIYRLIAQNGGNPAFVRTLRQELIKTILKSQEQTDGTTGGSQPPTPSGPGPTAAPILTNETLQNWTTIQLIEKFATNGPPQQPPPKLNEPMLVGIVNNILNTYSQDFQPINPFNPSTNTSSTSTGPITINNGPYPPPPVGVGPRDITQAKEEFIRAEVFLRELLEVFRSSGKSGSILEAALDFDELVMECSFQGADCMNRSFFTGSPDPGYGRCFTFNSAFNPMDNYGGGRVVGMTGKLYGLTLDLFIGQADYLPSSIAASNGIRITVHDPYQRPNPGDEGISLRPNTETDIAMKMLKVSRLGSPYQSMCVSQWDATPYSPIKGPSGAAETYSYGACQHMCESVHIFQQCSCLDPHTYKTFYYNGSLLGVTERLCEISKTDPRDFNCMKLVREKLQMGELECNCNLPCEDSVYESQTSSAVWPAQGFLPTIAANYLGRYSKLTPGEVKLDKEKMESIVQSEFARVNIYFRTLNLQTVDEQTKYDVWGFLSSLGGAVGLYLGMCGISLIEILEVVVLLAMAGLCKVKLIQGDQNDPRTAQDEPKNRFDDNDLDKKHLFRMTKSAELMRQQHVYPIKVPEADRATANHSAPQQDQAAPMNLRALYNF